MSRFEEHLLTWRPKTCGYHRFIQVKSTRPMLWVYGGVRCRRTCVKRRHIPCRPITATCDVTTSPSAIHPSTYS